MHGLRQGPCARRQGEAALIYPGTREVSSLEASVFAKDFVAEMQDVLRNEQAWGIAEKHLGFAYDRGRSDERNDRSGTDNPSS